MDNEHTPALRAFYQLADTVGAAALLVGLLVVANLRSMPAGLDTFFAVRVNVRNVMLGTGFLIFYHFAFELLGVYDSANRRFKDQARTIAIAASVASVLVMVFPAISRTHAFTWPLVFCFWIASVALAVGLRATVRLARSRRSSQKRREVIIVGSGPRALQLSRELEAQHGSDFRVAGFVDSPNGHRVPEEVQSRMIGSLENLDQILMRRVVDNVMIALPVKSCYDQIQSAIAVCEQAGVDAEYLPHVFHLTLARPRFAALDENPVVQLKVVCDDYRLLIKRIIDVIGASVGLICFGPLMLLIAVAIKLASPGPVFFTQERYGFNKRRFRMYKFRTMIHNAEAAQDSLETQNEKTGPIFKIRRDPRITALGRVLRLTSLDEVPQLWNILKGDMSLVGPRPMSVRDVTRFDEPWLMRRFSVRPGLTCLWQIGGRSDTTFERWMKLDLEYIDSWSLALDLSILARTIPAVIRCQGAA